MQVVADLHLHSKYSRAVSPQMTLPIMAQYAKQKGLDLLSASDFTHPLWFREIKALLEEVSDGIYGLKSEIRNPKSEINSSDQNTNNQKPTYFLLSTEIASIYKQGDKLRRIHNLVFVPNFETAEKVTDELRSRGCNLMADGRPIIGLSSKDLLELLLTIDTRSFLIPCHIWTPHFGIYGSASGFDSLEEAFGDLSKYIYGIETGLSSDPEMNWEIPELMYRSILSFSDAHSAPKMGREATVFDLQEVTYGNVREAIMRKKSSVTAIRQLAEKQSQEIATSLAAPRNDNRIIYTIEFYPEEGKYHFSGHRHCKIVYGPEEIREKGNICPVCKRRLTEGVLYRVQQLADDTLVDRVEVKMSPNQIKWYTDKKKIQPPYVKLVPLNEIIAESLHAPVASPKVKGMFDLLCETFTNEITVLLKTPTEHIARISGPTIADAITLVRKGDIEVEPGYDNEYGKVKISAEQNSPKPTEEVKTPEKKEQMGLF